MTTDLTPTTPSTPSTPMTPPPTEPVTATSAGTIGVTVDPQAFLGNLSSRWGWLFALGLFFIFLGTIGIGMSTVLTITTTLFFGVLLSIGGVLQIFDAFKCKAWRGIMLHSLIALLYLGAGAYLMTEPIRGSMILTLVVGASIFAAGLLRIVMGLQMKGLKGWGMLTFSGAISLALAGMILAQWPASGLWVIGLLVAIELLMHGWSYLFLALAVKPKTA